jgi:hypothetical protein
MTQDLLALMIVLMAAAYLVWKLALSGRRPKRRPDVPLSRLTKRR